MTRRPVRPPAAGTRDATTAGGPVEQTTRTMSGTARPGPHGVQWGRFRLLGMLGEGGFGSVYKAWDPDLEREIAIKILHPGAARTRLNEQLLREGRALAKVRHPNVVSVLGVESHDDQVALCMEFVEGETLERDLRARGALSTGEATHVGVDVCRALVAVHGAGLVHRDVKARNVMREQNGRVVLMDFGAGREASHLVAAGFEDRTGTPAYMAPEVLAGQHATPASDVYSVGVLLYHLVTEEYPVDGRTMDEVHAAHVEGRRRTLSDRRPDLPAAFVRVVDRALASDTARRYPNAAALLQALVALTGRSRTTRVLMRAVPLALGAFVLAGLLGLLTTAAFNLTAGRTAPFNDEPATVWLTLGFRSLVSPVLYIMMAALAWWTVRFAYRTLCLLRPVANVAHAAEARFGRLAARLKLEDPTVFAQAVATFGVVALVVIVWQFSDLLKAVTTTINDAPPETLRLLEWGPDRSPLLSLYRVALDMVVLLCVAALVRIRQLRARRPGTRSGVALPVVVVLTLATLLLEMPYRVLWHADAERVEVAGERCYLLGETETEALIFCPDRTPPRNRVIQQPVPRSDTFESMFAPADTQR